jgi:allantoicase
VWPDLASRALGATVVWANDDFFAAKENLIDPSPPLFTPATFTQQGQAYDGWETRRRRGPRPGTPMGPDPGFDSAVVRLGTPGLVHGVVVDTSHFLGNFPPGCSVDAAWCEGYPGPEELAAASWTQIVAPHPLGGGAVHHIPVDAGTFRFSHIRLNMLPDGGIARFRVHGEPVPDPGLLSGLTTNLAALRDGARILGCSDMFYGSPTRMLMPGHAVNMSDGWENARRRDDGNDWVELALAAEGIVAVVDIDTSHFRGNAPDRAAVSGARMPPDAVPEAADWFELLPETRLQPDTPHRFRIHRTQPATHLRLDVHPDGGVARFRAWGAATPAGLAAVEDRWRQTRGG